MARDIKLGWNVETLNKAYRQGYLAASMSMDRGRCPYRGYVVIAAWESGWEDGLEAKILSAPADDFWARIA